MGRKDVGRNDWGCKDWGHKDVGWKDGDAKIGIKDGDATMEEQRWGWKDGEKRRACKDRDWKDGDEMMGMQRWWMKGWWWNDGNAKIGNERMVMIFWLWKDRKEVIIRKGQGLNPGYDRMVYEVLRCLNFILFVCHILKLIPRTVLIYHLSYDAYMYCKFYIRILYNIVGHRYF